MHEELIISREEPEAGVVVLKIKGTLDAHCSPLLTQTCGQIADEGRHLVLCLSDIEFIASSGIGALLAIAEDFDEAGLQIRFADLSIAVSSVIELLNLDQFLRILPTPDEAVMDLAA